MNQASELRRHLLDRCGCGHYFGDHAAHAPHRCVTFEDPDCPCERYGLPTAAPNAGGDRAGGGEPSGPADVGAHLPNQGEVQEVGAGKCDFCSGRGVVEYEDPIIGGLVLAGCPDCEGKR